MDDGGSANVPGSLEPGDRFAQAIPRGEEEKRPPRGPLLLTLSLLRGLCSLLRHTESGRALTYFKGTTTSFPNGDDRFPERVLRSHVAPEDPDLAFENSMFRLVRRAPAFPFPASTGTRFGRPPEVKSLPTRGSPMRAIRGRSLPVGIRPEMDPQSLGHLVVRQPFHGIDLRRRTPRPDPTHR
jgi:hypothetical protein